MLMKLTKYLLTTAMIVLMVSGCTTYTPQKAPCDQYAANCGAKTKINQW